MDRPAQLTALFHAAVRAASPEAVMPAALPASRGGRIVAIAAGKAGATMMAAAQRRSAQPLSGLVVVPHGHLPDPRPQWPGVEIVTAGHPYPDAGSLDAADRALAMARGLGADDLLLVLLSGGGSALLAAPAAGVTLADKQAVTRLLLHSGATIEEINGVRKHLSRIKGGRLALAAAPARVVTWIVSDVPGDDPSFVASGPTVADHTSLADARAVIGCYAITPPASVVAALADPGNETPAADDPAFARADVRVIAAARTALAAAEAAARAQGWRVENLGDRLQGEARRLGAEHAVRALARSDAPRLILSGGETTVTVAEASGRGGRNLEYLLGLALGLDGAPGVHALACDTDGIDGTSDAAGATIGPDTLARARRLGLDPAASLAANDAHRFFARLGDLIMTGPTLTNVNDFRAILIEPGARA